MDDCGGSRNACKALVSSASQSHHHEKVSGWDKHEVACLSLSFAFASTSATVQGPLPSSKTQYPAGWVDATNRRTAAEPSSSDQKAPRR
ncbi:hypothetical protein TrVFT333_001702 [Trichoderma virens FT-333]|nr:hypothetical protein TrVFT333_001702 [Trichoderma virens FT-333]